jgi:hypothetical protein
MRPFHTSLILPAVWLSVLVVFPAFAAGQEPIGGSWCVDCSPCQLSGQYGNKAPRGDSTSMQDPGAGSHEECIATGGCGLNHPLNEDCISDNSPEVLTLLEDITRLMVTGHTAAARDLAARSTRARYVPERDAIQLLGCRDRIIAHLPLSDRSRKAIAEVVAMRHTKTNNVGGGLKP